MNDTYTTLSYILPKHGLMNPADLLRQLAEWMEADAIPAMCKLDCKVSGKQITCQHGNPSIMNFVSGQARHDAALIVNLRRLGITGDLQYIREKYQA